VLKGKAGPGDTGMGTFLSEENDVKQETRDRSDSVGSQDNLKCDRQIIPRTDIIGWKPTKEAQLPE